MSVRVTTDAYPGRKFEGTLTAINPDLDQSTRSVGLQATFDNPEQLLRPGMFARVEVLLPEEQPVLVIPATVRPERALRRLGVCDRVQAGQGQREAANWWCGSSSSGRAARAATL